MLSHVCTREWRSSRVQSQHREPSARLHISTASGPVLGGLGHIWGCPSLQAFHRHAWIAAAGWITAAGMATF